MLNQQFQVWTDEIDTALVRYFSAKDMSCNPLDRAMEYTLLASGKRLRPLLTMVAAHTLAGDVAAALPFALASEVLHTYSLIHDDLPCMDDDDIRRGKPSNHIIFGEAQAVLAGDALQAEAFAIMANQEHPTLSDARRIRIIAEFAEAVGRRGMVAGQVMDITDEGKNIDLERLKLLHRRKTGMLLRFCVRLGGHLAEADDAAMAALTTYAEAIGLMFQVVDDLLDQEGDAATLGKTVGKDAASDKATFLKLMGAKEAHVFADGLLSEALLALEPFTGDTTMLAEIAHYIRKRDH